MKRPHIRYCSPSVAPGAARDTSSSSSSSSSSSPRSGGRALGTASNGKILHGATLDHVYLDIANLQTIHNQWRKVTWPGSTKQTKGKQQWETRLFGVSPGSLQRVQPAVHHCRLSHKTIPSIIISNS